MHTKFLDPNTTCCVTGHRPTKIGGYDPSSQLRVAVYNALYWKVWEAHQVGYRTFLTGMALGVDQDFAEIVVRLRTKFPEVKLIAAVPYTGQEAIWPLQSRAVYLRILTQCDKVINTTESEGHADWKLQKRNEWMADRAQLVIAAYDGSSGGTANCIRYARTLARDIWEIDVAALRQEVIA